jgi:hypothetical protein
MPRALVHAAVAVTSLVAAGAVAELVLRALDFPPSDFSPWVESDVTGYAYAPSQRTRLRRAGEFDVEFRTNREGLRDDEVGPTPGRRILLLGDSFASGYGVERGEMFADLLESALEADVVNAAVGGFEIVHQVHYYASRGRELRPDVVLYALYLGNDLSRNDQWREIPGGGLEPVGRRLPTRTAESMKLRTLLERMLYSERLRKDDARAEWLPFPDYVAMCERNPSPETEERWRVVEELVTRLRDEVRRSGAEILVATFSYRTAVEPAARERYFEANPGLSATHDFSIPRERTAEILTRLGIGFVDLDAALEAHYAASDESLYFVRDGHWNALGHRVAASALEAPLRAALDTSASAPGGGA